MKNLLLAAALVAALGSQTVEGHKPPDLVMDLALNERAHVMTQGFIARLHLNEADYIHLRQVHRVLLASLDEINVQYANNPELRHAKLQELQGYYEQERNRVLTRSQMSRVEERQVHGQALPTIDLNSGGLG